MIKKNSHINHLKREFNENNSFMHFVYVFIKVVHERITLVWSYDNGFFLNKIAYNFQNIYIASEHWNS